MGIVLEKIDGCSEETIRRLLKIFSCLVFVGNRGKEIQNEAMYRVFMGGLLELIPVDAASARERSECFLALLRRWEQERMCRINLSHFTMWIVRGDLQM